MRELLLDIFERMLTAFGPQGWWPAETPFETVVGAILTQNTSWKSAVKAVEALKGGRLADFGRLMFASHESLRDLYEVSCPELDVLVESVRGLSGVLGAKMSGAGFGGAVVALVEKKALEEARTAMRGAFEKEFGRPPRLLAVSSGEWSIS